MARPRIEGIYELGHVLYALDAETHGFARSDIDRIESFWTFGDLHSSAAGFILALKDGRRAHVDFRHTHAFEQVEDFRIEVEFLPDDGSLPARSSSVDARGEWAFDTAHLDRALNATT